MFLVLGEPVEADYQVVGDDLVVGDLIVEPAWGADMEPDDPVDPLGFSGKGPTWPDGVVPYAIHSSVREQHRNYIRRAIREFESRTNIRWVRRADEDAFVQFIELDSGPCRAEPGYTGARRRVKLRNGSTPCNLGVVTHEMGHVIGLLHEQNRSDAGNYVQNLSGCLDGTGNDEIGSFDICSTMLYRSTTLSSCNIKLKPGTVSDRCPASEQCAGGSACSLLHDWSSLSRGDVQAINTLYPEPRYPDGETPPGSGDDDGAVDPDDSESTGLIGGCQLGGRGSGLSVVIVLLGLVCARRPGHHSSRSSKPS